MPNGAPWQTTDIGTGRPGLYINFISQAQLAITPGLRGVVGTIVRASWGPENQVQEIASQSDVMNYYTNDETAPNNAWFSLINMFKGGANRIQAYRVVGAASAKSTYTLQDTNGTPANIIKFDGKYAGTRGDNFKITVQQNAEDNTKTDVILKEIKGSGAVTLATWTSTVSRGEPGHVQNIVDIINGDILNFWITATFVANGNETPAAVTDQALTGGNDGGVPTVNDYTNALAALEVVPFNVLHVDILDSDVPGIEDALATWVQQRRTEGKHITWVTGSALGESVSTAETNAKAYNKEYIVYVYPGVKMRNASGVITTYRGAAYAAQIAGMISSLELGQGLTYKPSVDVVGLEKMLNNTEIETLLAAGVLTLVHDGSIFKIEKGINTLFNPGNGQSKAWNKISIINTIDTIATSVADTAKTTFIGRIRNDEAGQKALIGAIKDFLETLVNSRALREGPTVELDPDFDNTGDQVFLKIGLTPIDTMDYIYITVNLGV